MVGFILHVPLRHPMVNKLTKKPFLLGVVAVLLFAPLSGCLGDDGNGEENEGPIDLVVYYENTFATIEEIHNNGQMISRDGAEFSFDFRETRSDDGDIVTFSFDPGDGTDPVSIDAAEESILTYEYLSHGIFKGVLSAEDEDNNTASMKVTLRAEYHLSDTQQNTQDPDTASFDLAPDDDSIELPAQMRLVSTVHNTETPALWSDQVTVTWSLKDSSGTEIASNTEPNVQDGQSVTWEHQQVVSDPGMWTLEITIEVPSGNTEEVDVQSDLWTLYEEDESDPNPEPPISP